MLRSVATRTFLPDFPTLREAHFGILRSFSSSIDTSLWFLLTVAEVL